jgi:hypothetical protein
MRITFEGGDTLSLIAEHPGEALQLKEYAATLAGNAEKNGGQSLGGTAVFGKALVISVAD